MYTVYWIRNIKHKNPLTEGYVGLTKDLPSRLKHHRNSKKKTKLTSFLKSYDWLSKVEIEILDMNLTVEEACELEAYYRPTENIGLNLQRGGELGVGPDWYKIPENKEQHRLATSIATKEAIKLKDSPEARRERALKIHREKPEVYAGTTVGENNGRALLDADDVFLIRYTLIPSGMKLTEIGKMFNVSNNTIQSIKSGKNWPNI
jgi:predicted GIY-YIG superfamily endonuclease